MSAAAGCRPAGRDGVDAAVRHLRHRLGIECGVRPSPGRRGPGGDCTATIARLDAGGPVVGRCRGRPVGSWNGSPRRSTVLARARSGHSWLRGGVAVAGACRCGFSHRTATPDPGRHINPGRWTRIAADLLESVRIRPAVLLWVSRKFKEKAPPFRAGMNPTRLCHLLSYGSLPEFPRRDTPASLVRTLRVHVPRGNKSDSSPRRNGLADANRGTVRAEYPAVEGRTVFVPWKRPA